MGRCTGGCSWRRFIHYSIFLNFIFIHIFTLSQVLKEREAALQVNKKNREKEVEDAIMEEEKRILHRQWEMEKTEREKAKTKVFEKEWSEKRVEQMRQNQERKRMEKEESRRELNRTIEVCQNEIDKEKELQRVRFIYKFHLGFYLVSL